MSARGTSVDQPTRGGRAAGGAADNAQSVKFGSRAGRPIPANVSSFQDERTEPCSGGWDTGEHGPWGGEAGNLPELRGARKYVALLGGHISSKFNIAGRRPFCAGLRTGRPAAAAGGPARNGPAVGDQASPGVRLRDTAYRPETEAIKPRAEHSSARAPVLPKILQPHLAGLGP